MLLFFNSIIFFFFLKVCYFYTKFFDFTFTHKFIITNSLYYDEYLALFYCFIGIFLFINIIGFFSYFTSTHNFNNEKLSSYECGFTPYNNSTNIFEIKFFLVAILFIVFDIETMFILPWSVTISQINLTGYWIMFDFIIELSIGYIYLWLIGALNWN